MSDLHAFYANDGTLKQEWFQEWHSERITTFTCSIAGTREEAEIRRAKLTELAIDLGVPLIHGPGHVYRHRDPVTNAEVGPFEKRRDCIESLVRALGVRDKYVARVVADLEDREGDELEDMIPREMQSFSARFDPLSGR